jgi:inorganic pyrophosphatase
MSSLLENLPSWNKEEKELLNVVIEVPKGSRNKYELDHDSGVIFLDRVLYPQMTYPGDYGFVPQTLGEDGDPVDVVLFDTEAMYPGVVVPARVVGMLRMEDDGGVDQKILAVPAKDAHFNEWKDIADIPQHFLAELEHFFVHYKDMEPGKWAKTSGFDNRAEAVKIIKEGIARFGE